MKPRAVPGNGLESVSLVAVDAATDAARVVLGPPCPPEVLDAVRAHALRDDVAREGALTIALAAGGAYEAVVGHDAREGGRFAICVRVEHALAGSEARLRAMLEATSDGVWVVGPDLRTTWTNPALRAMLGYADEELATGLPSELAPARAVEGRSAREVRVVTKDGRARWVMCSSAPIRDDDGAFLGAIAILKDVTEHRESQESARRDAERLQEAHRLEVVARLAGGIAHDFNNLLTAVLTGAEILGGELAVGSAGHETVETIRQAGRRAAVLCRQLLALSGRGHFSTAPVDVFAATSEAVRALRPSVDARHQIRVVRGEGAVAVSGDAMQLQQLVTNLTLNASEAIGPRAGRIDVGVEVVELDRATLAAAHLAPDLPAGRYVRLSVIDDGPGIAEEVRERLFEPFVTTRTAGRGLGLPAVLGIVRGHGGAIRVESDRGEGTRFDVFLPIAEAPVAPRPTRTAPVAAGEGQLVLVVDDEAMVRGAACRVLDGRGFRTLQAADGVTAVELFREHQDRIAVVLLDLSMPDVDGVETLVRIRAIAPATPAVIMSGYSEHEAAARLVGVGFASFLAKPFTPDQLVERLKGALARER